MTGNERVLRSAALASFVYYIQHAAAGTAAEGYLIFNVTKSFSPEKPKTHDPNVGTRIFFVYIWRAGRIYILPKALQDCCMFTFHKGNVPSFMKFNKFGSSGQQPETVE